MDAVAVPQDIVCALETSKPICKGKGKAIAPSLSDEDDEDDGSRGEDVGDEEETPKRRPRNKWQMKKRSSKDGPGKATPPQPRLRALREMNLGRLSFSGCDCEGFIRQCQGLAWSG